MVDIIFLTIGRTEWACRKCPPPPFWVLVNCGRSYTQGNKERQFLFFSPYI